MTLGPLLSVSSWQWVFFPFGSEWSQPSSNYFTHVSSNHFPAPAAVLQRAGILALSLLLGFHHVTTFSQVLKPFFIRSALSPTPYTLSSTSFPPLSGHFLLKDASCLSDVELETVVSLSPSGGNGFWVADCNRKPLCHLSERRESGWDNEAQPPLANAHLCRKPKWEITSIERDKERLSRKL